MTPAKAAPTAAVAQTSQIVVVHAYGGCQDVSTTTIGPIDEEYYSGTPSDHLHAIAFYGCDINGESIQGYGPRNSPACVADTVKARRACPAFLRSPDDDNLDTDIRRFSYELAWYLSSTFGPRTPVALVGHSMGGLLVAYALQQVAAHNRAYPRKLNVRTVVALTTPFGGYDTGSTETASLQLRQMAPSGPDSMIPGILAGGAVQLGPTTSTMWLLEGSSAGCDVASTSSTLGLSGPPDRVYRVDYTTPCYTHDSYMWDALQPADATGSLNGTAFVDGRHALDLMHDIISGQDAGRGA